MRLAARIGAIEFDGDDVRLAVVKTGGKLPKVLEAHSCRARYADPDERPEALSEAVRTVTGQVKSSPSVYVLCVSSAFSRRLPQALSASARPTRR